NIFPYLTGLPNTALELYIIVPFCFIKKQIYILLLY
ncbi:MAG: hypothetical protein ACJA2S_005252, partial [Cyclobacteriaceae bacterium]